MRFLKPSCGTLKHHMISLRIPKKIFNAKREIATLEKNMIILRIPKKIFSAKREIAMLGKEGRI